MTRLSVRRWSDLEGPTILCGFAGIHAAGNGGAHVVIAARRSAEWEAIKYDGEQCPSVCNALEQCAKLDIAEEGASESPMS